MASERSIRAVLRQLYTSQFLDSIRTGIVVHETSGAIVSVNRAASLLLGFSEEQVSGLTPFDPRWGSVHVDGAPFLDEEHPSEVVLRTGEQCLGVKMGIDNPGRARRWLLIDAYPIVANAQLIGAISSLEDFTDQYRTNELLELLNEVGRLVTVASDEVDFFQQLCDAITTRLTYPLAWIGAASDDAPAGVDVNCSAGDTGSLYEGLLSWSGSKESATGPTGVAIRTGETQVVNDLSAQPVYDPWREHVERFGVSSSISIPFETSHGRMVLVVYARHVESFDEKTVSGLEQVCRDVEYCVAHLRSVSELAAALEGTLEALSYMTETRDPYTAGHQSHVGTLGALMATKLGLGAKAALLIRQSGDLHDVGKVIVPAEILTRPGRLTDLEFELVKQHTTVGSDILRKASLPWPIADVALQHHERMDGSGYPSGLRGEEIILPARIIAVADVVESMMQHRPYRPALGRDAALDEVTSGAGTRYDRSVVDACLEIFNEGFAFPTTGAPPFS